MVYLNCGPKKQQTCGDLNTSHFSSITNLNNDCEEGCFCPVGTVKYNDHCIKEKDCPCQLHGKSFKPGTKITKGCKNCICTNGHWSCTESKCSSTCSVIGDPHYTTFDGKRYDFMGNCTYYLVKGDNYSVEAENGACSSIMAEV